MPAPLSGAALVPPDPSPQGRQDQALQSSESSPPAPLVPPVPAVAPEPPDPTRGAIAKSSSSICGHPSVKHRAGAMTQYGPNKERSLIVVPIPKGTAPTAGR